MEVLDYFQCQKPVKNTIIELLGREWPLNLKQIHFELTKYQAINCSYQAVHKALKKLVEEGVLTKEERKYSLDIEWIRKIIQFGRKTEHAYTQRKMRVKQLAATSIGTEKNLQWPG